MMRMLALAFSPRFICYTLSVLFTAALLLVLAAVPSWIHLVALPLLVFGGFAILGTHDLLQTRHSVLRNYPISAHLRFLLEHMRPEMRQYFFEDEKSGMPFSRDKRAVVYQRAKMVLDKRPFGTQYDVYAARLRVGAPFDGAAAARRRAVPHHRRRARLHEALQRLGVQHLGDELRRAQPQRHPRAQQGRQGRRISPTTPARAA